MNTKIVVINGKRYRVKLARRVRSNPPGRFKKTAEFVSKDGQHAYRAGRNLDTGTWDHRHYVKHGNGWKHIDEHGYDGHETKEDAAAAAKADCASTDQGYTHEANPGRGELDEHAATELRLFIDNDADLYRQRTVPIHDNLARKYLKGTYDHAKAPILWAYLVEAGAKKYAKEYSNAADWNMIFSKATRDHVAKEMADDFLVELKAGNYTPNKIKRSASTPQTRYFVLLPNGTVLKRASNKAAAIKVFKDAGGKRAGLTIIRSAP